MNKQKIKEERINPLFYVKKRDLDNELDKQIIQSLFLYQKEDGKICPYCKIKQGTPYKGWNKYYCIHTENKINKKIIRIRNVKNRKLLRETLELRFGEENDK